MFATILIALMVVAGNMIAAITVASGLVIASGVVQDTTAADRVFGSCMALLGLAIFLTGASVFYC